MRPATLAGTLVICAIGLAFTAAAHDGAHGDRERPKVHLPQTILAFGTMYGVDGPFVGEENAIRGVPGDEAPWGVARATGSLDTRGHLVIRVRGLVFTDNPDPNLIGKNDEAEFRGLVSCLTEVGDSVEEANVVTEGFPATETGNSFIHAKVELPDPCVAPIVMVLAGSEDKWFAVTGFESEEDEE